MKEPWAELVAAIVRGTPRLPGALCRHQPDLFDGDDDQDARQAAEFCGRCPASEPCRAWSESLAHNEAHGILAGQRREWISHPSVAKRAAPQPLAEADR